MNERYRLNRFVLMQKLRPDIFLCTNFENYSQVLVDEYCYSLLNGDVIDFDSLDVKNPTIQERLKVNRFVVPCDCDEVGNTIKLRNRQRNSKELYHLIINPTLDCNLDCWYCYESKIVNSRISPSVVQAICKHLENHYIESPFKHLKLSFFGGEPMMRPMEITKIVEFAGEFCRSKGVELLLDFTTNATLISQKFLNFLAEYSCVFQITLDGDRIQHNKIKAPLKGNMDTFGSTIRNIHRIQKSIANSHVAIRVNFDGETLKNFGEILSEIKTLDRKRCRVILKKIWQVEAEIVDKNLIDEAINMLVSNDFVIDYYGQGGWCFADYDNQATINYDGRVFRCTTIPAFDEEHSLGNLNLITGEIEWDQEKIAYLSNQKIPDICMECKMLPSCGGPCRKQVNEGWNDACFLSVQNISMEDFALVQFKNNLVRHRIMNR